MKHLLKISLFLLVIIFQCAYAQEDEDAQSGKESYEITIEELMKMMPEKEIQFLSQDDIFQDKMISETFNELENLLEEKFKELKSKEFKSVGNATKAKVKVSKDIFYNYKTFTKAVARSEQRINEVLLNILHETKDLESAHRTVMEAKQIIHKNYLLLRDSINNRHKEVHNMFIALQLKTKLKNKGKKKGIPQLSKTYRWVTEEKKQETEEEKGSEKGKN